MGKTKVNALEVLENVLGLHATNDSVSFKEFVLSPDYLGLNGFVYDFWIEQGQKIPHTCTELILDGSIGGGKCLSINKLVSTNLGNLNGAQLRDLFKVAPGEDGYFPVSGLSVEQTDGSFEPVSHLYYEANAPTRKVILSHGKSIEATQNHPVLSLTTKDKQPKLNRVGDLKVGDYVLVRKDTKIDGLVYQNIPTELKSKLPLDKTNETKLLTEQNLASGEILPTLFEDYFYSRIESIEETTSDVYDITVPTTHMFMSEGIPMHNTSMGNMYTAYRLYRLFNAGTPQEQLGQMPSSPIYFLYFSVSMTQAKRTGFTQLISMIDGCKWFQRNYPRDKHITSSIRFPNNFYIEYASKQSHQIGMNVWGFCLDESNFRQGVGKGVAEEYEEVFELCQQLLDRQMNRFLSAGILNALAIFVSSASYNTSFIEKRKELAQTDPNAKVITSVSYELQPHKYSGKKFLVFIGYGQQEPCIVESPQHKRVIIKSCGFADQAADHIFRKVPVELKKSFQQNIYLALQNHCGVGTSLKGSFMRNISILTKSYQDGYKPPLRLNKITLSNMDDSSINDIFDIYNVDYPDRPRSIYLDLSTSGDSGSLACTRYDGLVDDPKFPDGKKIHTLEWIIEIVPPDAPAETMIQKIENFVVWFSQYYNLQAFGSDNYQSKQIRQNILSKLLLPDIRLSLDSSDEFHLHWVKALAEERLNQYYIERLDREIREAEHDLRRRKVLKRAGSTDDQFQAAVGSFFISDTIVADKAQLSESLYSNRMNIVGGKSVQRILRECGFVGAKR